MTEEEIKAAINTAWENCNLFMGDLFTGGDLEHIDNPLGAFRGPITGIELTATHLVITVDWTAHIPVSFPHQFPMGPPKLIEDGGQVYRYEREHLGSPDHIGGHRMHFTHKNARVTLFPKGGSQMTRPTDTITTAEIAAPATQQDD